MIVQIYLKVESFARIFDMNQIQCSKACEALLHCFSYTALKPVFLSDKDTFVRKLGCYYRLFRLIIHIQITSASTKQLPEQPGD